MRTAWAEAALADLVCADEDLLRAEFDALIAANWADSAPGTHPGRFSPRPSAAHRPQRDAPVTVRSGQRSGPPYPWERGPP